MVRQKGVDYDLKTKERKEFLTFTSEWYAYDYFGAEIKLGKTHIEDSYKQQTKKLVNKLDMTSGRMNSWYEMDSPRTALNIPFTKANGDKYLLSSNPFGPDSENITDPTQAVYYGKFEHQDTSTLSQRDNTYNYEQFVLPEWRDFCDLTNRTGGPRGLLKQYRQVEENKPSHIG